MVADLDTLGWGAFVRVYVLYDPANGIKSGGVDWFGHG
jgi:hypothetical protein